MYNLLSLRHMVSDTSGLRRLLGSHPSVDLHCQAEPAHHEDPEVWMVSHHPSYDRQQVSIMEQQLLTSDRNACQKQLQGRKAYFPLCCRGFSL